MADGSFVAFLNTSTSFTLNKDAVNLEKYTPLTDPSTVECSSPPCTWALDCRQFTDELDTLEVLPEDRDAVRESMRLDNALNDICDGVLDDVDGQDVSFPPTHELWEDQGGFVALQETMDPWRGEAIITSEGDFQVTFHTRIAGGGDFRFAFLVDPVFQPKECVLDPNDPTKTLSQDIDGNWLENWSNDLPELAAIDLGGEPGYDLPTALKGHTDGTLYYLNARAYMFNPDDVNGLQWSLPIQWQGAFASAKFSEEFFHSRTSRYADPEIYSAFETDDPDFAVTQSNVWYCGQECSGTTWKGCMLPDRSCDVDAYTFAKNTAAEIESELAVIGVDYQPLVHTNAWREADDKTGGLDGWIGLHYSYVVIDKGSDLSVGGSASGAFVLVFDGDDSNSVIYMQGQFTTDKIKRDRWVTDDVNTVKLVENGTVLCGGGTFTE